MAMRKNRTGQTGKDDLIVTPGGPRPKSDVHRVGPGEAVSCDEAGTATVVPLAQTPVKPEGGFPTMADNLVLTPCGFRDKSLVHHVPLGHVLNFQDDRMLITDLRTNISTEIPPSKAKVPALSDGWITDVEWTNVTGAPLFQFASGWQVPQPPQTNSGQTIFLFNAMESNGNSILQPVLQWGPSAAGGGPNWAVASWYISEQGHTFYTELAPVMNDQILLGEITLIRRQNNNFSYNCAFSGLPATNLYINDFPELTCCYETLEGYNLTQCSDYPNMPSTRFFFIQVNNGIYGKPLDWVIQNRVTDCGQHAQIVSPSSINGTVEIFYRS
jgi:hypothetical protein